MCQGFPVRRLAGTWAFCKEEPGDGHPGVVSHLGRWSSLPNAP